MTTDAARSLQGLHTYLDKKVQDWQARRELADLYEEMGEEVLAAGQRWQVKYKVSPCHYTGLEEGSDKPWTFHSDAKESVSCHLTRDLTERMHNGRLYKRYSRDYATRREAEEDLARALWETGVTR